MTSIETADHHGSHRQLLWAPDAAVGTARIDAIIVPTIRPAPYLRHAMALAKELGCLLVALCSGKWTSAAQMRDIATPGCDLLALDVTNVADLNLPRFTTSDVLADTRPAEERARQRARGYDAPDTRFQRGTDTAAKRNLGLALARMRGWRRVVFLDDDIQVRASHDLLRAASLLSHYSAVGLRVGGFPDNSVVCHAYRRVGGPQDSFVGGGALAVELTRNLSFFPDIYNEDWFYLLHDKGLRPLAVTGEVIQDPYEPFRTPERARSEELGDVLAEGVFWLLDEGKTLWDADEEHWKDFLGRRRRFVRHVLGLVDERGGDPAETRRMKEALKASLGRLEYITPALCVRYLEAWRNDKDIWRRYLKRLPNGLPLDRAVDYLTLPGRPKLTALLQLSAKPSQNLSALPDRVRS